MNSVLRKEQRKKSKMSLFGGGNMFEMLQQIPQMKAKLLEMKTKLAAMELTERSDDGQVSVTIKGDGTIASIQIAPEALVGKDSAQLEAILKPVLNRANEKVKRNAMEELKVAAGPLAGFLGDMAI